MTMVLLALQAPGVVQVEHVGVNVQSGGTVNYGVHIHSVQACP